MRPCSIYSRSLDRNARELSNLTPHAFEFEGVQCASMEGFLQALKYTDPLEQQAVCRLAGLEAKQYTSRRRSRTAWRQRGLLNWQGKVFLRESEEYAWLLEKAYQAMYEQSEPFRSALHATGCARLIHPSGGDDPFKTVLTRDEFCKLLTSLREQQKARL